MYHIYRCRLDNEAEWVDPCEVDDMQDECIWIDIDNLESIKLLPVMVHKNIKELIYGDHAIFLDSVHVDHHHG